MKLTVAAVQLAGRPLDDWRATRQQITEAILHARACTDAELIVLPEGAWPAYAFESPAAYQARLDAGMPDEPATLRWLGDLAQRMCAGICVGCVFPRAGRLANLAVLIGPNGRVLGEHQKVFLWDFDHDLYAPGERIEPVETPWGRVGLFVCADARMPEIPATLVARGARLLLQPTAWVNCGTPQRPWNPQPDFLIRSRAAELRVSVVSASKSGRELDTAFVGQSLVCEADGRIAAQVRDEPAAFAAATIELPPRGRVTCPGPCRARLLSQAPPIRPPAESPTVRIWFAPCALPDAADDAGVDLCITPPGQRCKRLPASDRAGVLHVAGPCEELLQCAALRVCALRDRDLASFAPLRAAALDGAALAIVFGDELPAFHVQTRAAENRIFVLAVGPQRWRLYDPTGRERAGGTIEPHRPAQEPALVFDPSPAADKRFAPCTDAFADRRVELYEF